MRQSTAATKRATGLCFEDRAVKERMSFVVQYVTGVAQTAVLWDATTADPLTFNTDVCAGSTDASHSPSEWMRKGEVWGRLIPRGVR